MRAYGSRTHAGERFALAALAAVGLTSAAFGQGAVDLDNSNSGGSLTIDRPGNYYGGIFGLEVWELNVAAVVEGSLPRQYGAGEYTTLAASGFNLEATFANQNNAQFPGYLNLGEVLMPDVFPPGAIVVLALAAWNTAAPSWNAMLASAQASTRAGIVVFLNPTSDYTALPPPTPPPLTGLTVDLVLGIGDVPPVPRPRLSITSTHGTNTLHWTGLPNLNYVVQSTTNLLGAWTTFGTVCNTQTNFTFVTPASDKARFYRVTFP